MTRAVREWVADHPDQAIPPRVKARGLTEADILARVQTEANTGCWLWERGTEASGYGTWPLPGKTKDRAHRVAFVIAKGPIPRGHCVCHRCDTPGCVNPDHLFLGTQAQNLADMRRKGRSRMPLVVGSANANAKITEDDVRAIRADPRNHTHVARDYGLTKQAVSMMRSRKTWRHVP